MTKKEIDHNYYLRNREKVLVRAAQYQKEYPESHRKASKEYEKRVRLKLIKKIIQEKA